MLKRAMAIDLHFVRWAGTTTKSVEACAQLYVVAMSLARSR